MLPVLCFLQQHNMTMGLTQMISYRAALFVLHMPSDDTDVFLPCIVPDVLRIRSREDVVSLVVQNELRDVRSAFTGFGFLLFQLTNRHPHSKSFQSLESILAQKMGQAVFQD